GDRGNRVGRSNPPQLRAATNRRCWWLRRRTRKRRRERSSEPRRARSRAAERAPPRRILRRPKAETRKRRGPLRSAPEHSEAPAASDYASVVRRPHTTPILERARSR